MKHFHIILLFTMICGFCFAEESINLPEIELRNWSFSFVFAGRSGGPGEDIEDAMVEAEFDKHSPASWFGSGKSHPFSRLDKSSGMLSLKRYINTRYSISICFSKTNLGTTFGYHDQAGYLFIDYSTSLLAPIISMNLYDLIRIGVGPSLYFVRAWESNAQSGESDSYKVTKFGLVLDTGIRIPWRSSFFCEFTTQYRKVGQVEIGPFTAEDFDETAELPKSEVNYDHWFLGLGIGIRF